MKELYKKESCALATFSPRTKQKHKSEKSKEKKKEVAPSEGKEVPYPLVPSKKDKERHLVHFLDIFKKLEITMPFREAL